MAFWVVRMRSVPGLRGLLRDFSAPATLLGRGVRPHQRNATNWASSSLRSVPVLSFASTPVVVGCVQPVVATSAPRALRTACGVVSLSGAARDTAQLVQARNLAGFGNRTENMSGAGDEDEGKPASNKVLSWMVYLLKLLMITSGALVWLDALMEWLYLTSNPEALSLENDIMAQDEQQMLKFFDVLHPNDPEVLAKQGALGHFTSILLHDPRVLKTLGEPPDVINDPDQVYVRGNHAVEVLQSVAEIPKHMSPRDHWAPAMFLAGPKGVLAAVVAFQRSSDGAEWVPHRCAGVELVPKDEPLFKRFGPAKHGLKYINRF